jgi:hypothetical protein
VPRAKPAAKPAVNVADEVSRGIVALLLKEPFYGHLLSGVVRRIDDKVDTAAVSLTPHGLHLIVNPEFFMKELKKDDFYIISAIKKPTPAVVLGMEISCHMMGLKATK